MTQAASLSPQRKLSFLRVKRGRARQVKLEAKSPKESMTSSAKDLKAALTDTPSSPSNNEITQIQDIKKATELSAKKDALLALFQQDSQSRGLQKIIAKNGGIENLERKIKNGGEEKINDFLKIVVQILDLP